MGIEEIIGIVIATILTIFARYAIPMIIIFIKSKVSEKAVVAVEQMYKNKPHEGKEKFKLASEMVAKMLSKFHIKINEDELKFYIEKYVGALNGIEAEK